MFINICSLLNVRSVLILQYVGNPCKWDVSKWDVIDMNIKYMYVMSTRSSSSGQLFFTRPLSFGVGSIK